MCEVTYFDIGDSAFIHSLASGGNLLRMTHGFCFGVPVNLVKSITITPITLLFIKIMVIIIPADDEYLYMNVMLLDYFEYWCQTFVMQPLDCQLMDYYGCRL